MVPSLGVSVCVCECVISYGVQMAGKRLQRRLDCLYKARILFRERERYSGPLTLLACLPRYVLFCSLSGKSPFNWPYLASP